MRDLIFIALALVGVYLLFSLLKLAQIKFRQRWPRRVKDRKEPAVLDTYAAVAREFSAPASSRYGADDRQAMVQEASPAITSAGSGLFEDQLFRSSVEAELQQLRSEVAALKETLVQLKASRRVSPQYSEAMLLAQRGMDVHEIAEQCAISIGEAELVLALSRNKQEMNDDDSEYERFDRDEGSERGNPFGQGSAIGR